MKGYNRVGGGSMKGTIIVLVGGHERYNHLAISLAIAFKLTIDWQYDPAGYEFLLKRNENMCPCRDFYMKVHSSLIHNSPKLETISNIQYPSTGAWMSELLCVHTTEFCSATQRKSYCYKQKRGSPSKTLQ